MGHNTERSTENEERKGEEEAEETRGAIARQTEQENPNRDPMELVIDFERLQAGQLCQTGPEIRTLFLG